MMHVWPQAVQGELRGERVAHEEELTACRASMAQVQGTTPRQRTALPYISTTTDLYKAPCLISASWVVV